MIGWIDKQTDQSEIIPRLFRDQFHLTRHRTEFCLFASHVYVKSRITSPVTCDAPINDLQLLKNIKRYSTRTAAAMTKFENHLSYVFQQFVNAHEMQYCPPYAWNIWSRSTMECRRSESRPAGDLSGWVTLLTVVNLVNCLPFSWCWHWLHLVIVYTWSTVQPVNYKEWSGDAAGLWSRSRRLEMVSTLVTYQRLVSVSSRQKFSTSRSRLGLGHWHLVPKTYFPSNFAGHNITVNQVSRRC